MNKNNKHMILGAIFLGAVGTGCLSVANGSAKAEGILHPNVLTRIFSKHYDAACVQKNRIVGGLPSLGYSKKCEIGHSVEPMTFSHHVMVQEWGMLR